MHAARLANLYYLNRPLDKTYISNFPIALLTLLQNSKICRNTSALNFGQNYQFRGTNDFDLLTRKAERQTVMTNTTLFIFKSVEALWPLLLTWFNFNPSMDK